MEVRRSLSSTSEKRDELLDWKSQMTIPNIITATRMACTPFLGWAVCMDYKTVALWGCVAASFSDWLDGYIARKFDQKSFLGGYLDPLADKAFIATLTVALTVKGLIPLPLCGVIVSRDVGIVLASFYLRYKTKPEGAAFFDTRESARFKVTPSVLSRVNTGLQMLLISTTLVADSLTLPVDVMPLVDPLWYITAVTTSLSGVAYLDGTGVQVVSKEEAAANAREERRRPL